MAGDKPWPEVPVGNHNHGSAAVVIIGAGISGLCTAIDLIKRNNVRNFVILEKSVGVGGTWHDNKYPGCCCDVWSTLYSYSFYQNAEWTREYPGQEEILAYLVKTAQEYNLYQHVRFNSTVEDATWDDEAKKWKVRVTTPKESKEGEFSPEYVITSDFLVSAVGQLNQPKWPAIEGLDSFEGKKMHSARWDWSFDLKDKNIAILGNGCTAVQILPELQKVAKHVTVFQRTPNWITPRMDSAISPFMRGVYRYLPPARWTKRVVQMKIREAMHDAVAKPDSNMVKMVKDMALELMHTQLADHPEMWDALTPKYNIGCKRIIASDDYYPSLIQPNVTLETRSIDHITPSTIKVRDSNGELVDAAPQYDLIVCATGFKTLEFMHPIQLRGRGGRTLSDVWTNGAQALNGVCVEDMPNFGMLYGPNTNLGHNSMILMLEAQSRYINGLITPVLNARRNGASLSMTPKKARIETYNARMQEVLQTSSFNDSNCSSWYKNDAGLITNNWSGNVVEYQELLSKVVFDDYDVESSETQVVPKKKEAQLGRVREEALFGATALTVSIISAVVVVGGFVARNPSLLERFRVR
nr:baeyer-villiger monooxygenase [Quercus suber]